MTGGGITLLIGGVRAGKSGRAVRMADECSRGGQVLFVATAEALDDEMRLRIDAHRHERALKEWVTLESPTTLADDISSHMSATHDYSVLVVDCLTLWVSNLLLTVPDAADAEAVIAEEAKELLRVLASLAAGGIRCILVTNEVGLGVVPPTTLGRRYRDALGRVNQLVAEASDASILMVAGLEMRLK